MLRITLKDGEALIVNGAMLRACGRMDVTIEGRASVLRGSEIISEAEATTPARRLYRACMLAYIGERPTDHQQAIIDELRVLVNDLHDADAKACCVRFAQEVAVSSFYRGLVECRRLIDFEDRCRHESVIAA